jgi:hypothetical protein
MSELVEAAILHVFDRMSETEDKDVDFFMDMLASCDGDKKARELVKSFRRQMIHAAAGEAITLYAD